MPRTAARPAYAPEQPRIRIKRSEERGRFNRPGWLLKEYSFSFETYRDPLFPGIRSLRALNETHLQPGRELQSRLQGGEEIITYVLNEELISSDSLGRQAVLPPGTFQKLLVPVESHLLQRNSSPLVVLRFIEMFFPLREAGLSAHEKGVELKTFSTAERTGNLRLVASPDGVAGSLKIHSDARIFSAILPTGEVILDRIAEGRFGWLQLVRGVLELNGEVMSIGDGAAISGGSAMELRVPVHGEETELLLFDLG